MNHWMTSAAAPLELIIGVHVFLGGPEIHHVLQSSGLSPDVRADAAVLWHAVTVILLVLAAGCLWLWCHDNRALAAGIDWADRLLPLPACLRGEGTAPDTEVRTALTTTGYFLAEKLAPDLGSKPLPEARSRFVDLFSRQIQRR